MRILLTVFVFSLSLFASLVSKDVNGGNGNFLSSVYLDSQDVVISAADGYGVKAISFDGTDLEQISSEILLGSIKDVAVHSESDTVYVAADNGGVFVMDYSDASSPTVVTTYDTNGQSIDLSIDEENALLAVADDLSGVKVYDISTPSAPTLLHEVAVVKPTRKVFIKDDALVVGYLDGEVEFYDISLSSPVSVYSIDSYLTINAFKDYEGSLAILDGSSGLFLYDISKVNFPVLEGGFTLKNSLGVGFNDKKAYISTTDKTVVTVDLSDKSNINYVDSESVERVVNDIFVEDGVLFASTENSLEIFGIVSDTTCVDSIVYAKNPQTNNWVKFYSHCDVPSGWEQTEDIPYEVKMKEPSFSKSEIDSLGSGWHLLGSSYEIEDLSIFNDVTMVWKYVDGHWTVISSSPQIREKLDRNYYPEFTKIEAGEGFWVRK